MNATEAKELTAKAKNEGNNPQRAFLSDRIASATSVGLNEIVIDYPHSHLEPEDYTYFKDLGFDVRPPEKVTDGDRVWFKFGMISW